MHIHWLFSHKSQPEAKRSALHFVEKKNVEREKYMHPALIEHLLLKSDSCSCVCEV
jgi:hypothetical protein